MALITPPSYYDLSLYSDSLTLIRMAIETYFANNLLRSDLSRVIFASEQYAFRQRLNLKSKNGNPSIQELDLPYMRYFWTGNWQIDDRPAVQNATAGLMGFPDESIGFQNIRFLQGQIIFNCTAFFSRTDDAQLAYETLIWIQNPAPQQFSYGSLTYKGYAIKIPILFEVEDIQWMPAYNETEWLEKAHIIPINFNIHLRSTIMSQIPQTPQSSTFWVDSPPVITENVLLDFLSYKFQNTFYDQSNYNREVQGIFTADPELLGIVETENITANSLTVTWAYNQAVMPYYTENTVVINVNGADNFTAPMNQLSYILTDLHSDSTYNITVWFTSDTGNITKYTTQATTLAGENGVEIPGIIGYT
jgi:hypothetical protein